MIERSRRSFGRGSIFDGTAKPGMIAEDIVKKVAGGMALPSKPGTTTTTVTRPGFTSTTTSTTIIKTSGNSTPAEMQAAKAAALEKMKTEMKAAHDEMKAAQEKMKIEMKAAHEKAKAAHEKAKIEMKANMEKVSSEKKNLFPFDVQPGGAIKTLPNRSMTLPSTANIANAVRKGFSKR